MLYVLEIIAFVGPNWMDVQCGWLCSDLFQPLPWLGHLQWAWATHFLWRKALCLTCSTRTKEWCCMAIRLHVTLRMLLSCVQLSFAKESLSLQKKKINKGLLFRWKPFRNWWNGYGGFMISKMDCLYFENINYRTLLKSDHNGLVTSLFCVNLYLSEYGISVHLLLN